MRSLHVPFTFYPDPVGGTEVYVASLARNLQRAGQEVVIAAPGKDEAGYRHEDILVRRFRSSDRLSVRDLYGAGDTVAAISFARLLQEEHPDVVHLHAWTAGVSLGLVREAKRRNIPVVFTYHTPSASCVRGTLERWGREVCDGALDLNRCTACTLHGLGVPQPLAWATGRIPAAMSRSLGRRGVSGDLWTGMRMRELVALRQGSWQALLDEADRIVAPAQWVQDLLLGHDVAATKVILSRQGIDWDGEQGMSMRSLHSDRLRVAYLGRLDPAKGADRLVRAVRSMPIDSIELHLFGITQGERGAAHERDLRRLAGNDPRIEVRPSVASNQVVALLRDYHLLAVPSRCLETGPLVVLEAFAAGIPVLGANRGGIAELVTPGMDGLLVEAGSIDQWRCALQRLADDRHLLARLQSGVRPPRTMGAVAREMADLYSDLLPRTVAPAFRGLPAIAESGSKRLR